MEKISTLVAGAAVADITPFGPIFLCGYPHVRRISTGVHDRLTSSALFLSDGNTPLVFVSNDVVAISKTMAANARRRIQHKTEVPATNVMITATHTHSGPKTLDMVGDEHDPAVPKADPSFLRRLEDGIVAAAVQAYENARSASIGFSLANGSCTGTNRHNPEGPSDPQVPVMVVRDRDTLEYIAIMTVCSMHPTVLHEDSRLISGDFPAMVREFLQEQVIGKNCPVIYHTGPSGNQSPRHVTRNNTFEEAGRLGRLLGQNIASAISTSQYLKNVRLSVDSATVELPRRKLPTVVEAEKSLRAAYEHFQKLCRSNAPQKEIRTAECDWFGAEESVVFASEAAAGRLDAVFDLIMPAEIMMANIGSWHFVGWPGEIYVEFALMLKARYPDCYPISLANGDLQGYLVTEEAVREHHYEALNSLLDSPASGNVLVQTTFELLKK